MTDGFGLKVHAGFDFSSDEFLIAFRARDGRDRGFVQASGYMRYEPPTDDNARPTLRLSIGEAVALAEALAAHGLIKTADNETPLKAHLTDAIAVRDRLMVMVERKIK